MEVGCFGKLPFALLDRLQIETRAGERYWADAVNVPAPMVALTSIDAVLLDSNDLPRSVILAILHSINDIYAANGIPSSFSISLTLPLDADLDLLAEINIAIARCAQLCGCKVGKIHTSRVQGAPTATVSALGEEVVRNAVLPGAGAIWLVGDCFVDSLDFSESIIVSNLDVRRAAVTKMSGPKKDVSGDGLIGALYQMTLRHQVALCFWEDSLFASKPASERFPSLERNYLDYAGFVDGLGNVAPAMLELLFAAHVFGPLICLSDIATDVADVKGKIIGSFKAGEARLSVGRSCG